MNPLSDTLGLHSPDGRRAQRLSAHLHVEVLGLMLRLTLRQTWRNTSGAPMATRWLMAQTAEQCLLNLRTEGPDGAPTPHRTTRVDPQRVSASLGILKTGEQITVAWRMAQLLHLDGGSLRLRLPAHLLPPALQATVLSIELHDPVARGTLGGCSHEVQKVRHANGLTLRLRVPDGLDKDLQLSVHGLRESAFAVASADPQQPGRGHLLVSRGLPETPLSTANTSAAAPRPVRLKLLIDQSGAIGGERQAQIQTALERLLAQLGPDDQLSCSRLGAGLHHELPRLQPCTEAYVRRARSLMRHTATEAGTPDWAAVLQSMAQIADEDENTVQDASILLVTGQPLSQAGDALPTLLACDHRLHVLAVGQLASDSPWSTLARASHGSCEPLLPGQHSQQTLQKLMDRIRSLHPVQAELGLQDQTLSGTQLEHPRMAAGDTLHAWASFDQAPGEADLTGCPQWHARLHVRNLHAPSDGPAQPPLTAEALPVLWDAQGDLARLCAHLAHPQAMATVAADPLSALPAQARQMAVMDAAPRHTEPPRAAASIHRLAPAPAMPPHPLSALVEQFNRQAPAYQQFRAALSATLQRASTRAVDGLVMQLGRQAGNPGRVWAMLLHWLHTEHALPLQGQALQLVEQELAPVALGTRSQVHAAFTAHLNLSASRRVA